MKRLAALLVMVALAIPIASASAAQTFTFHAQCVNPSAAAGVTITGCSVVVDPDTHNGNPGTALMPKVNGSFSGNVTATLSPGLHKLAIVSEAGPFNKGTGKDGTLTAVLVITVLIPGTSAAYPCEPGYIQIEEQSWWQNRTGEAWPGRHVHQQACWPTGIVRQGQDFTIPIRWMTHAQRPGAAMFASRFRDGDAEDFAKWSSFPAIDANGDLTHAITDTINNTIDPDGLNEIKAATKVRVSTGIEQWISSNRPIFIDTFSGGQTGRDWAEARAWYSGFEYGANARTRTRLAAFPVSGGPAPSWPASADPPSGTPATTPSPVVTPTLMPPPSVCA